MITSRRILAALGAFSLLVLCLLIALPLLYRGPLEDRVKTELSRAVAAEVGWEGVGLTFFRNFPNLTLRLDDFALVGVDRFAGDTLASVGHLRIVVDLASALRGLTNGEPIVVRSIELDRPTAHLLVLEDGTANWDIWRATASEPEDEAASTLAVSLKRFDIRDATITFDNRPAGLFASLIGFRQSLSGDFSADSFTLRARALAEEATLRFAGIPYLNRVKLDVDADVQADMLNQRFSFGNNEVRLNDLLLAFAGSAELGEDSVGLDVTFEAPRTDFKEILSLVPAVYARDFHALRTSGAVAVSGRIHGAYRDDSLPAFALRASVENGSFQYPDLPLPARDIFVTLAIDNPGGDADRTVVNLERFRMAIGNEPIDATLVIRTPVSDPTIDLRLQGKADLADVNRTLKLEGIEELTGVVAADLSLSTRLSFVDTQQYDRIRADGSAEIRNLAVRMVDVSHPIAIEEAILRLTPRHAELRSFRGRIGSSDLELVGHLDNLLGFALRDEDLRGRATLHSTRFDLNEWQSEGGELSVVPVPGKLDFALQANIAQLLYGNFEMTNARGALRVKDQRLEIEDFLMNLLGAEIAMGGFYETTDLSRPTFDARLRIQKLDIPAAFHTLATVQMLAPVARYAQGNFSADLRVSGVLGEDMMPVFEALNGRGALETSPLVLLDFPAMERLADALGLQQLRRPALDGVRSLIEIRDGRLHVSPFDVRLGDSRMNVTGSNGIDQSLDYALRLHVPRNALGTEANRVVAGLLSQAGRAGVDLQAAEEIELGVQLTGSVLEPVVRTNLAVVMAARGAVEGAVRGEVTRRVEEVEQRVDEATAAARLRLQTDADRLVRDAEQRALLVREEAQKLAEGVRLEGDVQANSLLERATNPLARTAARPAADRLRREADERAQQIVREGDRRADELVAEAQRRASALMAEDS
jgi:hypothetical protein